MSARYPIISVTGSSGAGTSTVKHTFEQIFRREEVSHVAIEGDAFHRYDRAAIKFGYGQLVEVFDQAPQERMEEALRRAK